MQTVLVLPAARDATGILRPDISELPAGTKVEQDSLSLDRRTYRVYVSHDDPATMAALLLQSEDDPLALAVKALLDPMIEQTNQIAERAGHQDLTRSPGQIAESAKLALEKGQGGGDKDPGPGDTKTPPKEIGRG